MNRMIGVGQRRVCVCTEIVALSLTTVSHILTFSTVVWPRTGNDVAQQEQKRQQPFFCRFVPPPHAQEDNLWACLWAGCVLLAVRQSGQGTNWNTKP